jgi:hypothetical protein
MLHVAQAPKCHTRILPGLSMKVHVYIWYSALDQGSMNVRPYQRWPGYFCTYRSGISAGTWNDLLAGVETSTARHCSGRGTVIELSLRSYALWQDIPACGRQKRGVSVCVCVPIFSLKKPQMQSLQICGGVSHDNWARFDGAKQDIARERRMTCGCGRDARARLLRGRYGFSMFVLHLCRCK